MTCDTLHRGFSQVATIQTQFTLVHKSNNFRDGLNENRGHQRRPSKKDARQRETPVIVRPLFTAVYDTVKVCFFYACRGGQKVWASTTGKIKHPEMAIEELKRNKDFLEGRYLGELKEIQAKRAALDMWERNARNAMINGDSQCLDDTDKTVARVVQSLSPDGPTRDEGKGKMPIECPECPEFSDSEEEFLESVVAINSSDCQALQIARSSESLYSDDDDDDFIYPDPSQSDMQATTTINMSDYVHVESSTS